MLDISHIPSQQQSTFTFYATGNWQTFVKPRNAKFIEIFCLGAGAGGGHCTIGAGAVTGGGGGGSAGIVRGIIPAFLLPDTLYIQVGKGGAGAKTNATAGGSGGVSYISLNGTTSEQTLICKSSTSTSGGGQANNTAGTAASVAVPSLSAFSNLGLFTAIAGVAGSAGGTSAGTNGNSQDALSSNLITGGSGGGGKTASIRGNGGFINPASAILTVQVVGGVSAINPNGGDGYGTMQPFCGTGGAGGGSVIAGTGGKGGNGFYGCGGGGVGGCSVVSAAGDGGDGLVIITVIS